MGSLLKRLFSDEAGQDLAEYAVALAVISAIVVAAVTLLGGRIAAVIESAAGVLP